MLPRSVDLYTPSPWVMSSRRQASPVPAYITLGSESETAIAPTEDVFK